MFPHFFHFNILVFEEGGGSWNLALIQVVQHLFHLFFPGVEVGKVLHVSIIGEHVDLDLLFHFAQDVNFDHYTQHNQEAKGNGHRVGKTYFLNQVPDRSHSKSTQQDSGNFTDQVEAGSDRVHNWQVNQKHAANLDAKGNAITEHHPKQDFFADQDV